MNRDRIKVLDYENSSKFLINSSRDNQKVEDKKISFSFEDFNGDSVIVDDYNNYYFNVESSRNAVADFFEKIKNISKLSLKKFFEPSTKVNYHLNKFDDEKIIERIEMVLIKGYSFPPEKVEQFEKEYWEFQISDGKRVICHRVDEIFYPLFIDCNHMICKDSSRAYKAKMGYGIKSSFVKQDEKDLSIKDKDIISVIEMILESADDEKMEKSDIVDLLKEIVK